MLRHSGIGQCFPLTTAAVATVADQHPGSKLKYMATSMVACLNLLQTHQATQTRHSMCSNRSNISSCKAHKGSGTAACSMLLTAMCDQAQGSSRSAANNANNINQLA
jgi:hypothetical protein